jgi:CDP-L-myo-inositol myo-inositolphosphotransferase
MVGGLLAHFSSVLDGVDGELARLRDDITPFGSLLDSLLDRLSDISLIIALGFALSPTPISLALTGLATFGAVSVSYVSQLAAKYVYVEKLRVSFPWATRDVRLFTITLGGLTLQPLLPIIFCAIAPLAFTARTLVRVKSLRRSSARTVPAPATGSRVPEPRISVTKPVKEEHIIRENLESLVVNILKLAVSLSILQLIRGPLEHMWNTKYLPAYLDARLAIDVAQLVVSVYFGYRILLSTKFFADMATDLVVTRLQITQSMYARITTDTFYLIISGLAWSVTSPIIAKLPEAVSLLGLVINLAFFAFMVLLTYDLLRTLHRGLRGHWDSMMGRLADWLGEHLRHPDRECIKR